MGRPYSRPRRPPWEGNLMALRISTESLARASARRPWLVIAAGDLVMFQQMGFGLAVAVLLDATIVRSVLVPAAMELLGARNWYLPSALRWLPEMRLEATPQRSQTTTVRSPEGS